MNRIDRLSAILVQLQSRSLVKAQDIASRFSISLRTVYRDIHALEEAGVPILGEAGIGYRMMEGYKLPPIMFNMEEATALLTAGKLVLSKTDGSTSRNYASALEKIRAILRHSEKDHLEGIEEHIVVIRNPSLEREMPENLHLQEILKAISAKQVAEIDYNSGDQNEMLTRKIEPVGIYHQGNYWYLLAFCLLRNDYRNFRTDKIKRLKTHTEAIKKDHPPLQSFIDQMTVRQDVIKVVIAVPHEITKYFGEQKYYNGFVSEEFINDEVHMTFLSGSLAGFARWYLLFGEQARILEPVILYDQVTGIMEKIQKKIAADKCS